jgi:hypothetical protein
MKKLILIQPDDFVSGKRKNPSGSKISLLDIKRVKIGTTKKEADKKTVNMEENIEEVNNSPEPSTEISIEIRESFVDNSIEREYNLLRVEEWLYYTRNILFNRLAPGFSKNGLLDLPSCPYKLVKKFMMMQECTTYCRVYK